MDDPSDPPNTAKTFRYERGWRVVSREVSTREGEGGGEEEGWFGIEEMELVPR